jgi:Na+/proline symporter
MVLAQAQGVVPEVSNGPLTIGIVALYFIVVVGIGAYFFRQSRESSADFWIAGGKIPTYVQVFAYLSVLASAGSFFGIGGFAYRYGIAFAGLVAVAVAAGGLFAMIFLAAPIRRSGVYTVPDYLKERYRSTKVRMVATAIFAIAAWAYLIPQLTAAGITLNFVLPDVSYVWGVVIGAVIFATYVSVGGMWAVTWTDFVQGVVMVVMAVLPAPLILLDFGGIGGVLSAAIAEDPGFGGTTAPGLMNIGVALVWILAPLGLPQMGQRMMASDSDRAARRGLMWMAVFFIGAFMVTAYIVAAAAQAIAPNLATADYFYYAVLNRYFGPVLQGLGAAGLLAAVMSTTDALLVALSASVSHDLPNSLGIDLSDGQETWLGTGVIWAGALTAMFVAFNPPAIIALMTTLVAGGAASGLFPALAVGTWWKRANEYGALASMIVGFGSYGILLTVSILPAPYSEVLIAVPLGLLSFVGVSLATRRPDAAELDGFQSFHQSDTSTAASSADD